MPSKILFNQNYSTCQKTLLIILANVPLRDIMLLSLAFVSHHLITYPSFRCCKRLRMAAYRCICQSWCILPGWDSCCKCARFRFTFKRKGPLDWYIDRVCPTIGASLSNNRPYKLATTGFSLHAFVVLFYQIMPTVFGRFTNRNACIKCQIIRFYSLMHVFMYVFVHILSMILSGVCSLLGRWIMI